MEVTKLSGRDSAFYAKIRKQIEKLIAYKK